MGGVVGSAEREALVSASLSLRYVSGLALREGARSTAVEALNAAKKAEAALSVANSGCPGCGSPVVQVAATGRPRRWCVACSPQRKTSGKPQRATSVEP